MRLGKTLHEASVAQALESGAMRRILSICIDRPRAVKDISDQAGLPLASAYRQVKTLVDQGVLVIERSAMTEEGKPFDLYRSRVRRAQLVVAANQVTVTWEVNESVEERLSTMWGHLAG